jgi:hypothetical protein
MVFGLHKPKVFSQSRPVDRMSARLLNSQADSIRDLAVALDNSSVDQAKGIGWVQVDECDEEKKR